MSKHAHLSAMSSSTRVSRGQWQPSQPQDPLIWSTKKVKTRDENEVHDTEMIEEPVGLDQVMPSYKDTMHNCPWDAWEESDEELPEDR